MAVEILLPQAGFPVTRRWPRYKVNLPVRVLKQKRDRLVVIEARGAELNAGGISVLAIGKLAIGERVGIEFKPPYSAEPIRPPRLSRTSNRVPRSCNRGVILHTRFGASAKAEQQAPKTADLWWAMLEERAARCDPLS